MQRHPRYIPGQLVTRVHMSIHAGKSPSGDKTKAARSKPVVAGSTRKCKCQSDGPCGQWVSPTAVACNITPAYLAYLVVSQQHKGPAVVNGGHHHWESQLRTRRIGTPQGLAVPEKCQGPSTTQDKCTGYSAANWQAYSGSNWGAPAPSKRQMCFDPSPYFGSPRQARTCEHITGCA